MNPVSVKAAKISLATCLCVIVSFFLWCAIGDSYGDALGPISFVFGLGIWFFSDWFVDWVKDNV